MAALPEPILTALEAARQAGRAHLDEPDALELAAALGIGSPVVQVVSEPTAVDAALLGGTRAVVKAVAPGLIHKTERAAVAVVAPEDVAAAVEEMAARVPEAERFLVAGHVDRPRYPWGELLLGMRWTDEFGPVVTLGFGGISTEFLAGLGGSRATAVFSPALRDGLGRVLDGWAGTGPLTEGFRGSEPLVARPELEDLIGRALDLAARAMPGEIASFEVNPLVFTADGPIALDALCEVGPVAVSVIRPDLRPGAVEETLRPGSIGIVGVSERMNLGRAILRNVLAAGFPPESITIVKPGVAEIEGVRCVAGLEDLDRVDLLVVAIGAGGVPDLVEQVIVAEAAGSIVLIPGGLGERPGSEQLADRLADALREAPHPRPVINGPNCMGIRSVPGRCDTTFIPAHKLAPAGRTGEHPVAIISQSGAFAIARHDRLAWLDPAYLITVGNQLDLAVGDYLDHLADDPEVEVAACYIEGFRPGDGLRWAGAASRMTNRGGTVVVYRAGRTEEGAGAAAGHTAAVAGDAVVADAVAEAAGALVADSLEDFEDLVRLAVLLRSRRPAGTRLGVVTNAGFEAVAAADRLGGFTLADLDSGTGGAVAAILATERLDEVVGFANPLDLTPNCTAAAYAAVTRAVLDDPGVDLGVVGCVPLTPALQTLPADSGHEEDVGGPDSLASRLIDLWRETDKPWVAVVDAGALYDPMARMLEQGGIPTFRTADRALRALGRWAPVSARG